MSVINRMLRQTAVYWAPTATPDEFGNPQFAAPIEIKCRWENMVKTVVAGQGEQQSTTDEKQASTITVYVDRDLVLGGYVRLGSLADNPPADPRTDSAATEIMEVHNIPNFKATEFLRWIVS